MNDFYRCGSINKVTNYLKFRMSKDYQETGKCRVHIGDTFKGYGLSGLILKKGHRKGQGNLSVAELNRIFHVFLRLKSTGTVPNWTYRILAQEIFPL